MSTLKHLRNFLDGVCQVLIIAPDATYERPQPNAFAADVKALRDDNHRVTRSLRRKTLSYDQSHYHR